MGGVTYTSMPQRMGLKNALLQTALAAILSLLSLTAPATAAAQPPSPAVKPFSTILYGAAYYHEYMPYERLDKDIALMKAAGFTVVRMGESTWSLWEPEDGRFDYAWMDRVVEAMGKAGIKVILGTPTYSVPAWMAHQHPEILVRRMNGDSRGAPAAPATSYHVQQFGRRNVGRHAHAGGFKQEHHRVAHGVVVIDHMDGAGVSHQHPPSRGAA